MPKTITQYPWDEDLEVYDQTRPPIRTITDGDLVKMDGDEDWAKVIDINSNDNTVLAEYPGFEDPFWIEVWAITAHLVVKAPVKSGREPLKIEEGVLCVLDQSKVSKNAMSLGPNRLWIILAKKRGSDTMWNVKPLNGDTRYPYRYTYVHEDAIRTVRLATYDRPSKAGA